MTGGPPQPKQPTPAVPGAPDSLTQIAEGVALALLTYFLGEPREPKWVNEIRRQLTEINTKLDRLLAEFARLDARFDDAFFRDRVREFKNTLPNVHAAVSTYVANTSHEPAFEAAVRLTTASGVFINDAGPYVRFSVFPLVAVAMKLVHELLIVGRGTESSRRTYMTLFEGYFTDMLDPAKPLTIANLYAELRDARDTTLAYQQRWSGQTPAILHAYDPWDENDSPRRSIEAAVLENTMQQFVVTQRKVFPVQRGTALPDTIDRTKAVQITSVIPGEAHLFDFVANEYWAAGGDKPAGFHPGTGALRDEYEGIARSYHRSVDALPGVFRLLEAAHRARELAHEYMTYGTRQTLVDGLKQLGGEGLIKPVPLYKLL